VNKSVRSRRNVKISFCLLGRILRTKIWLGRNPDQKEPLKEKFGLSRLLRSQGSKELLCYEIWVKKVHEQQSPSAPSRDCMYGVLSLKTLMRARRNRVSISSCDTFGWTTGLKVMHSHALFTISSQIRQNIRAWLPSSWHVVCPPRTIQNVALIFVSHVLGSSALWISFKMPRKSSITVDLSHGLSVWTNRSGLAITTSGNSSMHRWISYPASGESSEVSQNRRKRT
jgi:hypothetical protein